MSELPPTTPSAPQPVPPTPVDPKNAVQMPAIALMALSAVYLIWILLIIGRTLFGVAVAGGGMASWIGSGIGLILGILFNLALAGLTFYGGMQMKSLRNYNLALAGAIAALLPCNCCCVNIIVGVWALIVLMKPEVKAAFGQSTPGFPVS